MTTTRNRPTGRRIGERWGVMAMTAVMLMASGVAFAADKVPADSATPTAGFCASEAGRVATVSLHADYSNVRCLSGRRGQELRVVNRTGARLIVRWARWRVPLAAGHAVTFGHPLASYLAAGDHRLSGPRYYSVDVMVPGRVAPPTLSAG